MLRVRLLRSPVVPRVPLALLLFKLGLRTWRRVMLDVGRLVRVMWLRSPLWLSRRLCVRLMTVVRCLLLFLVRLLFIMMFVLRRKRRFFPLTLRMCRLRVVRAGSRLKMIGM